MCMEGTLVGAAPSDPGPEPLPLLAPTPGPTPRHHASRSVCITFWLVSPGCQWQTPCHVLHVRALRGEGCSGPHCAAGHTPGLSCLWLPSAGLGPLPGGHQGPCAPHPWGDCPSVRPVCLNRGQMTPLRGPLLCPSAPRAEDDGSRVVPTSLSQAAQGPAVHRGRPGPACLSQDTAPGPCDSDGRSQ